MAPGFQKLINKWVKISRNAGDEASYHGTKKNENHCEATVGSSTACSTYYAGNLVDENPAQRNVDEGRNEVSEVVEAVESMSMKQSEDDVMSEDDSWISEEEETKVGAFLHQVADFIESEKSIPFDLIELWVPVYESDIPKLCHAGHVVTCNASNGDDKNDFGQSSMAFSFEPGCGMPGRVFTSGLPIWESDLPSTALFDRREDAKKHGINTALGLPVDSTIGRIVVMFYTHHQITRDEKLIQFIQNAISSNWNPNPTWIMELDSDMADDKMEPVAPSSPPSLQPLSRQSTMSNDSDKKSIDFEIANLLAEHMPMDNSPLSSGFVPLRLVLLRPTRSPQEEEIVSILRRSYNGYLMIQRPLRDIALLLVQDYMLLQSMGNNASVGNMQNIQEEINKA